MHASLIMKLLGTHA